MKWAILFILVAFVLLLTASRWDLLNLDSFPAALLPVWQWLISSGLRILATIIGAWLIIRVGRSAIYHLERFLPRDEELLDEERQRRLETLKSFLSHVLTVVVVTVAGIMVLKEAGFDIAPLITAAGIGGLAISLGAQNLIRDYLAGLLILFENQFRVGDVIQINGEISGVVEQLSLRTVSLRSLDGTLHVISNGQINTISNMTKSFSRYVIDVQVAYKENVDQVMKILQEVGDELAQDPYFGPLIAEKPEVLGVDDFASSGVVIKTMVTTQPLRQWEVGREFRRRIKNRFDERGIEIPFPHLSLYWGEASKPMSVNLEPADQNSRSKARS